MATKSSEKNGEYETGQQESISADQEENFPVTLEEFCIRLSAKDRRVEMIGAFEHVEKTAGRLKDIESEYTARYEEFINKPV